MGQFYVGANNTEAFLRERRKALKDSVVWFERSNLPARECWVVRELLENPGVSFALSSVQSPADDPPDVVFGEARFEVKELLDAGRERHKEYKQAAARAEDVADPQDLLVSYFPVDITPAEIAILVSQRLNKLQLKYPAAVRQSLDCVIYVNLLEHLLKAGPMPSPEDFTRFGWRSISAVCGWGGLVFFADAPASAFLRERVGQLLLREFE